MDQPSSPLWKQLVGAMAGAGLALVLYGGYSVSAPVLTAWLIAPQSQIDAKHPGGVRSNDTMGDIQYKRFVSRSQEIYSHLAAEGDRPLPTEINNQITVPASTPPPPPPVPQNVEATGAVLPRVQVRVREMPPIRQPLPVTARREAVRSDQLPGSGIGIWMGATIAALGTLFILRRRLKHLFT